MSAPDNKCPLYHYLSGGGITAAEANKGNNITKTHLVMLRVPSVAKDISTKIGHKHKELPYFKTV